MTYLWEESEFVEQCHNRWMLRRNRVQTSPSYQDDWYGQQCGGCRFYVPLSGPLGEDYGGCTNAKSAFDKQLMFEHDGCPAYEGGDGEFKTIFGS